MLLNRLKKIKNTMLKITGLLLIAGSLFLGYRHWPAVKLYYTEYMFAMKWAQAWRSELEKTDMELPKQWARVGSIALYPTDWKHKFWLQWVKAPISINPKGDYHLDILILSWDENNQRFVVLQYNLRERDGRQNMIWEGGQTLQILN